MLLLAYDGELSPEVTRITAKERDALFRLLRLNATAGDLELELKQRSLAYSAVNWDELLSKRIVPALDSGALDDRDLYGWLRDAEEYGRQHVFLYKCSKTAASEIVNEDVVKKILSQLGRSDLLNRPKIVEEPPEPTITDVRLEQGIFGRSLVVKVVETRTYERYVGTQEPSANRILREYEKLSFRAINVARVHEDGFAEIRVFSHRSKIDYTADVADLRSRYNILIPQLRFSEVPIGGAKWKLWHNRKSLTDKVRYSSSLLRDKFGTVVSAATGDSQLSLFESKAAKSLDVFWDEDAICDRSNLWWLKGNPRPTRDIHTLMSGAVNEFAVTTQCSRGDYDYVLDQVRQFNT